MFRTAVLALLLLITLRASAQKDKQYVPMCVGWYNVENLYDTVDAPETDDAEWLATAPKMWNSERYQMKLDHLARVISEMAKDVHPDGLALLGLCEIENRAVLEDLVKQPALAGRNYQIVHHDGPDRRGVDAAFLYNPKYFKLVNYKAYPLINPEDTAFRTREQLVVTGVLDGDTVSCIMAHWPSRRGGEKASQPKRFMAAKLGRHIADSLLAINPNARIMYMGDLNDDPVDPSVRKFFGATEDKSLVNASKFYNPMYSLYQKGHRFTGVGGFMEPVRSGDLLSCTGERYIGWLQVLRRTCVQPALSHPAGRCVQGLSVPHLRGRQLHRWIQRSLPGVRDPGEGSAATLIAWCIGSFR